MRFQAGFPPSFSIRLSPQGSHCPHPGVGMVGVEAHLDSVGVDVFLPAGAVVRLVEREVPGSEEGSYVRLIDVCGSG